MIILNAGEYKSGKTVSSCTFIDACKQGEETLLLLDINDGFESVKHSRDMQNNLIVPRWEEIIVEKFYRPGVFELHMNTPDSKDFKAGKAPDYTQNSIIIVKKLNTIFQQLFDNQGVYNDKKIKVLVLDALSDLFRIWKEGIMNVNKIPNLRIGDYGTLEGMLFGQFIPTMRTLSQHIPWIILTNHISMDKDEILGSILEFPIGPSNAMGRLMGKEFDEVWKMGKEEQTHIWNTRDSGFFKAGSRLHLPAKVNPATYKKLAEILEGRK